MNRIYWIQTTTLPGKRHCYLVSAPYLADAIVEIQDNWCDDDEEIIDSFRVSDTYDTDENHEGKVVVKIHN